ncbi:MAG: DUF4440 domain-containing protein [Candidatus Paceibacterota bacterium]
MEPQKVSLELFLDLETKLHRKKVRNSPKAVSELLADDFIEFGSSGYIYNKNDTLKSLAEEKVDLEISVKDFKVKELSSDIVLVTYQASKLDPKNATKYESLRSSIWKLTDRKWQMVFHQGTRIAS